MTLMSTTDRTGAAADIATGVPRSRFAGTTRPNARPRPGLRLAASVDRALADLTAPAAAAELTAGLAWTAALGETCLLSDAVGCVRRGIAALRAGEVAAAVNALEAARSDLPAL